MRSEKAALENGSWAQQHKKPEKSLRGYGEKTARVEQFEIPQRSVPASILCPGCTLALELNATSQVGIRLAKMNSYR